MKITIIGIVLLLSQLAFADQSGDCLSKATQASLAGKTEEEKVNLFNKTLEECSETENSCFVKLVKVCPPKKPKKKAVVLPPLVVTPICPEVKEVVKVVEKKVLVPVPVPTKCKHGCPPEDPFIGGFHAAMGFGVRPPYLSGQLGIHLEVPRAYLGLRIFSTLQYGMGAQLLPYVYRGKILKVHVLDPGFLLTGELFGNNYLNNPDVPRKVDMLLGAGVQVKIHCNVSLTADWRVAIPDPVMQNKRSKCEGCDSYRLDTGVVMGNAFAASQVLLGIMVHN